MTTLQSAVHSSAHLRLEGVSWSYPDRRVLTDVSLTVSAGERVGLIGENGSGKSTLLRIAAGVLTPETGAVTATAVGRSDLSRQLMHQEPPFRSTDTIHEAIESAVAPIRAAIAAIDHHGARIAEAPHDAQTAEAYAQALDTAERLNAWTVDARIHEMLAGLGLDAVSPRRLTSRLSGGQRSRLSLAWVLLRSPDVLLLDEPTNHLDDAATAYLNRLLLSWSGPVLLASHDRAFLDETVTSLVDLDPSPIPHAVVASVSSDAPDSGIGTTRFTGTYTDYLAARSDDRRRWEQQYRDEQAELRRLQAAVRDNQHVGHTDWRPRTEVRMAQKFYADRNATVVARRVNDARSRLDDLSARLVRKPPQELQFGGLTAAGRPSIGGTAGPVLVASHAAVLGRLRPTSVTISAGEHWLITGPNGSGKSTLLQLLSGRLAATTGSVHQHPGLRLGMLSQDTEFADPDRRGAHRSVQQTYVDAVGITRAERVPLITWGLIAQRDVHRPVGSLSQGQQRRLALSIVLADPPDVLLLDEPTNHLSLPLVTALEEAIDEYPGTVVIASHDRWLRRRWRGEHLDLTFAL